MANWYGWPIGQSTASYCFDSHFKTECTVRSEIGLYRWRSPVLWIKVGLETNTTAHEYNYKAMNLMKTNLFVYTFFMNTITESSDRKRGRIRR